MKNRSLIYVVDPMCSWCWGFSPVFEEIVRRYQVQVNVQILLGGLRPGNKKPFDAEKRDYVLHHWHAVHERTGQPFNFTFHMSSDFTYDTEPPSRAVRVVRQLAPDKERAYLKAVQEAFYVQNRDVTREQVLSEIAEGRGLEQPVFLELFRNPVTKKDTWEEFAQARDWGVDGFPTLLGRHATDYAILMHGYQTLDKLAPILDRWLARGHETATSMVEG